MSNRSFSLALIILYHTFACKNPEQKDLTIYSLGGSKLIYPLDCPLNLPEANFNGYELAKANPEIDLDKLFIGIADKFEFKCLHPFEFAFLSRGELEFDCVNSQTFIVRVSEKNGIVLEIKDFGTFRLRDPFKIEQFLISESIRFLPLFRFNSWFGAPLNRVSKITEEIGEGVTLEQYSELVTRYAGSYKPGPISGFPKILTMNDCDEETLKMELCDKPYKNIYEAVNGLLNELGERFFVRQSKDCLLSCIYPPVNLKMYQKSKLKDSLIDFIQKFIFVNYFAKNRYMFPCSKKLFETFIQNLSIESSALPKSGRLVKVFCSLKEILLNRRTGALALEIDSDSYMVTERYPGLIFCNRVNFELNAQNAFIPLKEIHKPAMADEISKTLEFLEKHMCTIEDKLHLALFAFTIETFYRVFEGRFRQPLNLDSPDDKLL